jgi:hypothetical protein
MDQLVLITLLYHRKSAIALLFFITVQGKTDSYYGSTIMFIYFLAGLFLERHYGAV